MVGIGVIGYGYWGPNLVRNFSDIPGCRVVSVSDMKEKRLGNVVGRYPAVKVTTDFRQLLKDSSVDAVAIATPVSTHFDLAMEALRHGKHVLVEKPMTSKYDQSLRLIEEANRLGLVLMVDHTFIYTGAVRKVKELVMRKELGEIRYYDSTRVNLGLFQHDVNVIWDLAVHDLSILDYILGIQPVAVSAVGINHISGKPENIAYLTLFFESNLIAHINVNWLTPVKLRMTLIGGSKKMIVYDDLQPSEKIKVYDSGITIQDDPDRIYQVLIGYRTGDMWAPQYDRTEALKTEAMHFIECINDGKRPITDGEMGSRIVRILEAAIESIKGRGRLVELNGGIL